MSSDTLSVQGATLVADDMMARAARAAARASAAAALADADAPYETIRRASDAAASGRASMADATAALALASVEDQEPEEPVLPITRAPELVTRLGQGSFGTVWSARDEHRRYECSMEQSACYTEQARHTAIAERIVKSKRAVRVAGGWSQL